MIQIETSYEKDYKKRGQTLTPLSLFQQLQFSDYLITRILILLPVSRG